MNDACDDAVNAAASNSVSLLSLSSLCVCANIHMYACVSVCTKKSVESLELSTSARCSELRQQCLTAECELEDKVCSLLSLAESSCSAVTFSGSKLSFCCRVFIHVQTCSVI